MENYSNNTKNENLIMLIMAAAIMLFNLIGFIVVYFVWKEYSKESYYIKINGARLLDFHISYWIYTLIASVLCIVFIGILALPIIALAQFILSIIGMIKYGTYKYYEYPLTFRFIQKRI